MIKSAVFITLFFVSCSQYNGRIAQNVLDKADLLYQKHDYTNANKYYQWANKAQKGRGNTEKAAQSALKMGEIDNALAIFLKMDKKSALNNASLLKLADIYKSKKRYVEAKRVYARLSIADKVNSEYYSKQSLFCDSARLYLSQKSRIRAMPLTRLNSNYDELSPFLFNDTLYYSSNKEGIFIKPTTYIDDNPPYAMYLSDYNIIENPTFSKATKLTQSALFDDFVNMSFVSFTEGKQKMYFSCTSHSKNFESDTAYRIKMYSTDKDSLGKWQKPHTFIMNDANHSFAQPFVDKNNTMFFFASDLAGGFGGTDIWVCINIENKWTNPINLGPFVNTLGDELFPFYHEDGTLYFTSNYHPGFGGFDIFKAIQKEGDWTSIFNAGSEINSSANEASIGINKEKNLIVFSSDRKGGKGKYDLYYLRK